MDFELSADQEALRDAVRALCEGRFSIEFIRTLIDEQYVDRTRWRELADTGVFSLVLPEAAGGVGLGYQDAVIVFEELGRALVPGPLVGTFLAAGIVDGAATGDAIVGLVERPRIGDGFGDGRPQPAYVEHLGVVDVLLVLDDDGVWQIDDVASVLASAKQPKPLDPLTPVWRVDSLPPGTQVASAADAVRWQTIGATLTSAETSPETVRPPTEASVPSPIASSSVARKPRLTCCAVATGTTISALTSSSPTVRIATVTVTAAITATSTL